MRFGGLFRERSFYQSRAAKTAYRGAPRAVSKAGLAAVVKPFYSPIPDLDALPPGTFERRSELPGIDWDLDRQLAFVRERLGPAMREFDPPPSPDGNRWQYAPNLSYTMADAKALYAM